jgi:hypothetical protein
MATEELSLDRRSESSNSLLSGLLLKLFGLTLNICSSFIAEMIFLIDESDQSFSFDFINFLLSNSSCLKLSRYCFAIFSSSNALSHSPQKNQALRQGISLRIPKNIL